MAQPFKQTVVKMKITRSIRLVAGAYATQYFNSIYRYVHIERTNGTITKTLICLN